MFAADNFPVVICPISLKCVCYYYLTDRWTVDSWCGRHHRLLGRRNAVSYVSKSLHAVLTTLRCKLSKITDWQNESRFYVQAGVGLHVVVQIYFGINRANFTDWNLKMLIFGCNVEVNSNKLCGMPPQFAPAPVTLTFDLESGVRVTCDVGYLCVNFSLPTPLCSRLRPDVRDRQTSHSIIRLKLPPRGH